MIGYKQLFLVFALFNSLAIHASNKKDYAIAGMNKEDTLAIINSYLEHEHNFNLQIFKLVAEIKTYASSNESEKLTNLHFVLGNNDSLINQAKIVIEKGGQYPGCYSGWVRGGFLSNVQILGTDLDFANYPTRYKNVNCEYNKKKSQHFEEYFREAEKFLAADPK